MTTTIQKWGNSQGVRLPKYMLDSLKWSSNEKVVIIAQDNKIIIEQAGQKKRKTIDELFDGYEGNYVPEEIDWGDSSWGEAGE
ncbi:MAG: AbrB/MazE/SpoVT family DNA-binding domain-containing protein [Oscillospiraceae bacterium]|nr:AbrB/MazE/SpoVT family DNA-binding domain-containing protein [Oscillospiraceae bacterium]